MDVCDGKLHEQEASARPACLDGPFIAFVPNRHWSLLTYDHPVDGKRVGVGAGSSSASSPLRRKRYIPLVPISNRLTWQFCNKSPAS